MKEGTLRIDITEGAKVDVVEKHNQQSGKLTHGTVKRILTKSPKHPHGIKVMLAEGPIGRVKKIYD